VLNVLPDTLQSSQRWSSHPISWLVQTPSLLKQSHDRYWLDRAVFYVPANIA